MSGTLKSPVRRARRQGAKIQSVRRRGPWLAPWSVDASGVASSVQIHPFLVLLVLTPARLRERWSVRDESPSRSADRRISPAGAVPPWSCRYAMSHSTASERALRSSGSWSASMSLALTPSALPSQAMAHVGIVSQPCATSCPSMRYRREGARAPLLLLAWQSTRSSPSGASPASSTFRAAATNATDPITFADTDAADEPRRCATASTTAPVS